MPVQQVSNAFRVEIDGNALPSTVDLMGVEVEDHLRLPDAFTLSIKDTDRSAIGSAQVKIGSKVKISVLSDAEAGPATLLEGEVTALEAEFHAGFSVTLVRGYDQSHRLFRGRNTESYLNMTYADIATKVGSRRGGSIGQIDATSPTHEHVAQSNESDWSFLNRLAAEVGYEVTVADEKLHFRKPSESDHAPRDQNLSSDDPLALMPGSTLLSVRVNVTAAEQVKEIEVRGWDPKQKQLVKATAPTQTDAVKNGSSSAAVADVFPGPPLVSSGMVLASDQAAEQAAKALADRLAASQSEVEGKARGNPKLRAGAAVRLAQLGDPFDGRYVLTATRHVYDPDDGYVTWFTVSGRVERSTLALAGGGSGGASGGGPAGPIVGVVPALVDDVDDPEQLCRVRLKFPWLSDSFVSDWSRVAQAGAAEGRGFVVLPEVGDEVLVAFEQGDIRRSFVIGSLYNASDKPELGPGSFIDSASKAINNRLFTSRKGHQLVFVDADDGPAVVLQTSDKSLVVRLDEKARKIVISSGGDLELKADGDLKLTATGSVTMNGASVSSEATSSWSAKGASATLEGSGPVSVKGQPIQLN
jgi:phage protein D/phage baseplate assembly protein gpV